MEIVINKCFGGFNLSNFAEERLGTSYPERTDGELISLIKEYGSKQVSGPFAKLKVVEIPEETTDYEIDEYDGLERIMYVVNGKIYHTL